jgi:hypothetical protein
MLRVSKLSEVDEPANRQLETQRLPSARIHHMDIPDRKLAPDDRRKDRISAETGHRKDIKKGGAGGKGNVGRPVSASPRRRDGRRLVKLEQTLPDARPSGVLTRIPHPAPSLRCDAAG